MTPFLVTCTNGRRKSFKNPSGESLILIVLKAAAYTYVAAALASLLNLGRWLMVLRGAAINNLPVPEQLSHPISLTQGGE